MMGGLTRALDNLFGRGDAAVTVPPLDGALRPNRLLDEALSRHALEHVDCLAVHAGKLVASAGTGIFVRENDGHWTRRGDFGAPVTSLAAVGAEGLAIALASGEVLVEGGPFEGRRYKAEGVGCITAMVGSGSELYLANGSATNGPDGWQRDLLEQNATGGIWRLELESGRSARIAQGLAWPAGIALDASGIVVSEAWTHRLLRIDLARPDRRQVLYADLPGYPGRMSQSSNGWWLAVFAPRSQLVEFVLREPAYRSRMMAEVPQAFWVAPTLRAGRSYYEPLQGGGVKHLGLLKPWAPTMSFGLCVRLDQTFQPRWSLQSRADGNTHGITSAVEHGGRLVAAARGEGLVISLPLSDLGGGS